MSDNSFDPSKETLLNYPIEKLRHTFSVRLFNCLRRAGIRDLRELVALNPQDLLKLKNFGRRTLLELDRTLAEFDLELASLPPQTSEIEAKDFSSPPSVTTTKELSNECLSLDLFVVLPMLSVRTHNCLKKRQIRTLQDLLGHTSDELLAGVHFGRKSLTEIVNRLEMIGLSLDSTNLTKTRNGESSESISLPEFLAVIAASSKVILSGPKYSLFSELANMYKQYGTLRGVAQKLGLSKERVRQLLVHAETLGVSTYRKQSRYPQLTREAVVAKLAMCGSLKALAKILEVPSIWLKSELNRLKIRKHEISALCFTYRKQQCISQFNEFKEKLGYMPSTSDLQRDNAGKYLYIKIVRYWGSIAEFRRIMNIPWSEKRVPYVSKGAIQRLQKRRDLRKVRWEADCEQIMQFSKEANMLTSNKVATIMNISLLKANKLLKYLAFENRLEMYSIGNKHLYRRGTRADEAMNATEGQFVLKLKGSYYDRSI